MKLNTVAGKLRAFVDMYEYIQIISEDGKLCFPNVGGEGRRDRGGGKGIMNLT